MTAEKIPAPFPYSRVFLAVTLALIATPFLRGEDVVSVTSETYFGECVGYCRTVLVITDRGMVCTAYSTDASQRPKSIKQSISQAEWLQISQGAPLKLFFALPDRIGDPDSADQGGEILEIRTETRHKKTTFDYNAKIVGMEKYLKIVRSIRDEMQSKLNEGPEGRK